MTAENVVVKVEPSAGFVVAAQELEEFSVDVAHRALDLMVLPGLGGRVGDINTGCQVA